MEQRAFGSTGETVSALGIGALISDRPEAEVAALMECMLDAGANLIDTAQCYPGHEELIGRYLSHRRQDFLLVSKCGHHDLLPDGSMRSRAIGMEDIDGALRRLRCDHLDGMLLHSYDLKPLMAGDAIAVLETAKAAGKVRWIGYSGDAERALWAARSGRFDIIECTCNLADQACFDELLPLCKANGLAVIAKRPVANVAWMRGADLEGVHESVRTYHERLARLDLHPADYGCADFLELALRFTLSAPGVATAIVSSSKSANQDRNLALAAAGPLPAQALVALRDRWRAAARSDWAPVN
jgi:aryl-alcohol dehydrogenase-like predicted oxidoreductase